MAVTEHCDITQQVDLTDPLAVQRVITTIVTEAGCTVDHDLLSAGFNTFAKLYAGSLPGYHGCETFYHDMQHALDVTLACARLLAGYERMHDDATRLGNQRVTLGILVALFHDAGYIRHRQDSRCWHGAQYTLRHVARGARLLSRFLIEHGCEAWARDAVKLIHYTGYEIPLDKIRLKDPRDQALGQLIGTADLIAQMADRAYLEKCRDYLFEEFMLGGLTSKQNADGSRDILYHSGNDLLSKTPAFYTKMIRKRLDIDFAQSYRFIEPLFSGKNPYVDAIERNMQHLERALAHGRLEDMLRRRAKAILAPQQRDDQ